MKKNKKNFADRKHFEVSDSHRQKSPTVIPAGLLMTLWAVWAIVVLINYNRYLPWRFAGGLFNEIGYEFHVLNFVRVFFTAHIINMFYALAIFLAAFTVGHFLMKYFFHAEDKFSFEEIFISTALGLGIIAVGVFLASGPLRLLDFTSPIKTLILKLLIYITAGIGIIVLRNFYITNYKKDSSSTETTLTLGEKLVIALLVFICFINLLGALTPETFYDSQFYQLGVPARWLLEGRISADNYIPASFMPFNVNIIYLLAMLLSKGEPIIAKLVHCFSGVLIALALYSVGKRIFSRMAGLISALIFLSIPVVMMVSWKSAVELGIGVFEFGCFLCFIKVLEIPAASSSGTEEADFLRSKKILWVVVAGLLCGFSVGSKYTSVAFCYIPSVLAILFFKEFGGDVKGRITSLIFFSQAVLIAASPWYVRNLVVTGNPVHPFFWQKLSRLPLRPGNNLFADPAPPTFSVLNYFGFLWPLTMGNLQQESYLSAVFLVFLPLLFGVKNVDRRVKFSIVYLMATILFWAKAGRFYARYFIPTMAAASFVYGYYITHSEYMKKTIYRFAVLAAVLWCAFAGVNFAAGILSATQDPLGYVIGEVNQSDYLSTQRPSYPAPYYPAVDWINKNLPADSKILFVGETRALYLKKKFRVSGAGEWWWYQEKLKSARSAEDFYNELKSDGITHILFNAPEARRLSGYEPFYFDQNMLRTFDDFWRKYVREKYKDIADIYLPQYAIRSMKRQQPEWWSGYLRDPLNYVYVYEILPQKEAATLPQTENFLLRKDFYPQRRWEIIESAARSLSSDRR